MKPTKALLLLFLLSTLCLWHSQAQAPGNIGDSLMKLHFQNQAQVWDHVETQRDIQQVRVRAAEKRQEAAEKEGAVAAKIAQQYRLKWAWFILLGLTLILTLAYLFWKRIQYRFQEYHNLREESERTYDLVQQNHQWQSHLNTGSDYLDQEAYSAAIETFAEALNHSSRSIEEAQAHHYLGVSYWHLYLSDPSQHVDALSQAEFHLDQVEKLCPHDKELVLDTSSWLIEIYRHLKQKSKAILVTEKSIVLARELRQEIKVRKLEKTLDALEEEFVSPFNTHPETSFPKTKSQSYQTPFEPVYPENRYKPLYENRVEVFS